jgi:hypothetical protein
LVPLDEDRPLFAFAGLWTRWRGMRGPKGAPVGGEHQLFGFLEQGGGDPILLLALRHDPERIVRQRPLQRQRVERVLFQPAVEFGRRRIRITGIALG